MSASPPTLERPLWATESTKENVNDGVTYVDGPYREESPDRLKELSYSEYNDTYFFDEVSSAPCITTKFSLNSLLRVPTMTAAPVHAHHNVDAVEPIFEVVSHVFSSGHDPITYTRCSHIADKRNGDPFLFRTSIYYSDGTAWSEGASHGSNNFLESAKASGHFLASEEKNHIDFTSTVQAFLSQFNGTGPQRFDRPTFILPQAK